MTFWLRLGLLQVDLILDRVVEVENRSPVHHERTGGEVSWGWKFGKGRTSVLPGKPRVFFKPWKFPGYGRSR